MRKTSVITYKKTLGRTRQGNIRRSLVQLLVIMCSFVVTSCATTSGTQDEDEDLDSVGRVETGRNEVSVTVRYEKTAKENWIRGEEEYADESYVAAQKFYSYIRSKFPYSAFTPRAELRIADCLYARRRFVQSIDTYQNFVRLYSTHPKVPYANFQTAKAYHAQVPDDMFILPPSHEKDQGSIKRAAQALTNYVTRYPKDENIEEGKKLLREVRERLMRHEQYVADFYRKQGKMRAYVGRLEVIRRSFRDIGVTEELLFLIAETYAQLGEAEKLKSAVDELAEKFPESPLLAKGKALAVGK